MSPVGLTPKQLKVLEFIRDFTAKNGFAPAQTEIAKHFGFQSLGTVQNYLVRLQDNGFLTKKWNGRRSLAPVSAAFDFSSPMETTMSLPPAVALPLLGRVAAGAPIEAIENREEVAVPLFLFPSAKSRQDFGKYFVLKVVGSSMIEDGILDGDYVVIRRQPHAESGQTVVALINHEATIKKMIKSRSQIELHPANPKYQPIRVNPQDDFRIEGVLVGVVRRVES